MNILSLLAVVSLILAIDEPQELLRRAERSVAQAAEALGDDPNRPAVHFRPPAQWMNDPNGTIYHNGSYHLFYQHNPYGDAWGNMHWGHAISQDLVHWEHRPIALWPSKQAGEDHVFSGCAAVDGDGQLVLYYTSVGAERPNEQWAALPLDEKGIKWKKYEQNPLITVEMPDGPTFENGMRDPFVFRTNDRTFMVVGADTETESVLPMFEATDESLLDWQYKGIIWRAPKSEMAFPECPNFFPIGDQFLLLTSPYRPIEYRVGNFDLEAFRFEPETFGRLDFSDQYYASNIAKTPDGRLILFGWIRGFPENQGWNGCLAFPRELKLGEDDRPRQHPVSELQDLRTRKDTGVDQSNIGDHSVGVNGIGGNQLEVLVRFEGPFSDKSRVGIQFVDSKAPEASDAMIEISRSKNSLRVADFEVSLDQSYTTPQSLHVFLDRSVLEVFVDDGRHTVTRVVPNLGDNVQVRVFDQRPNDADTSFQVDAWELNAIWPEANSSRN